jgi:hypothetical protein
MGYRSGLFDTVLLKYSLVLVSSAVVVAVSRPWKSGDAHSNSFLRSSLAWAATLGCVILVFAVNFLFTFWYGCSHENCMP